MILSTKYSIVMALLGSVMVVAPPPNSSKISSAKVSSKTPANLVYTKAVSASEIYNAGNNGRPDLKFQVKAEPKWQHLPDETPATVADHQKYPERSFAFPSESRIARAPQKNPNAYPIPENYANKPMKGPEPIIKIQDPFQESFAISKTALDKKSLKEIGGTAVVEKWNKALLELPNYLYYKERSKEMYQTYISSLENGMRNLQTNSKQQQQQTNSNKGGLVTRKEFVSQVLDHVIKLQQHYDKVRFSNSRTPEEQKFVKAIELEASRLKSNRNGGDKTWDNLASGTLKTPSEAQIMTLASYLIVSDKYGTKNVGIGLRYVHKGLLDLMKSIDQRAIALYQEIRPKMNLDPEAPFPKNWDMHSLSPGVAKLVKEYQSLTVSKVHVGLTAKAIYQTYYPLGFLDTLH